MIIRSNDYRKPSRHGSIVIEGTAAAYHEITSQPVFVGTDVPAIPSATYDLDLTTEEGYFQISVALLNTDSWDGIATKLQTAIQTATSGTETAVITSGGALRVTSDEVGVSSLMILAAGTAGSGGGDLIASIDALTTQNNTALGVPVAGTAGDLDAAGYAEISNTGSLGTFAPATVPAIASNSYSLDVTVDGGGLNQLVIALLNTDTWAGIATKLQTAIQTATGSTEQVEIINGRIRITSATGGSTSSVLIAAGTGVAAGGDLLTAITALGATYTATLETPVAGTEGQISLNVGVPAAPADDFWTWFQILDSTGIDKTAGFKVVTDSTAGTLVISDAGSSNLAAGDQVAFVTVPFTTPS